VVNFLTFKPYFEWEADPQIPFQARHSEIAPYLMRASRAGVRGLLRRRLPSAP
jgi:hypothetical protein